MKNDIASRINDLCKALGQTQFEFADAIGYHHSSLSNIKTGKTKRLSRELILAILARYSQVNENWLRTGEGSMFHEMAAQMEGGHGSRAESAAVYTITRCAADPECRRLCETYIEAISLDAREMLTLTVDILRSGNKGVINSLKHNLITFKQAAEDSESLKRLLRPKPKHTGRKAT